ncbi:hypothetical protein D3C83_13880 [compost metagenome]
MQHHGARGAARQPLVVRQADRQAPVGLALDDAVVLKEANTLAHRGAVDAELLDQLGLGADRLARPDAARENAFLNGFRHQLVRRDGMDPPELLGEVGHLFS